MNAENFCYWLQGFLEISQSKSLTAEQMKIVKDHLALVFQKLTPPYEIIYNPSFTNIDAGLSPVGGPVICSTRDLKKNL